MSKHRDLVFKNLDKIQKEVKLARIEGRKQAYVPVFGNTKEEVRYFTACLQADGLNAEMTSISNYNTTEQYILVRF